MALRLIQSESSTVRRVAVASHVDAVLERHSGLPVASFSRLVEDLGLGPEECKQIALVCFVEIFHDFEPGDGDLEFVASLETVHDWESYFEDLCETSVEKCAAEDFHFNF